MYTRNIETELHSALADTPVVLLNGARQTGKSTLAQNFADASSVPYVTLDDATQLAAAGSDAQGFLGGLGDRAVIDEVQKAPELFPAIKMSVDRDRRPGALFVNWVGQCVPASADFRVAGRSYGIDYPMATLAGRAARAAGEISGRGFC